MLRVATVFDLRPDELLTDVAQPDDQRPLRVAAGTSARPLAIGSHVPPTNVQRWEAGDSTDRPSQSQARLFT